MKKGTGILLIVSALVLILIIIVVKSYSRLTTSRTEVINKESDITVQLSRKSEQISSLINVCSNYFTDEELYEEISETIAELKKHEEINLKCEDNKKMSELTNKLFEKISVELLEKEDVKNAVSEIISTEKRIKNARNNYNTAVEDYNSKVNGFPSSIIASIRGFKTKKECASAVKINNILETE